MPLVIKTLTVTDTIYPPLLRQIAAPPKQLYYRGNKDLLSHPSLLAVVGSREPSDYGKGAAQSLLPTLVQAGIVIVSGLAYGIDSLAHTIAVAASKPTIAVLGCGLDQSVLYPRENIDLANAIVASGGLLLSEYAPTTTVQRYHFPARNRIIAGLCKVTLVLQAARKSGSLITARLAAESNREVAVIPGRINDPLSAGTNELLRDGAHCILEPADILDLYGLKRPSAL